MLAILLKFGALLPGIVMFLGGAYGAVAFVPRVLRNPDDSLSQVVLATAAVAMLWGLFQLWTSYRAFLLPEDGSSADE